MQCHVILLGTTYPLDVREKAKNNTRSKETTSKKEKKEKSVFPPPQVGGVTDTRKGRLKGKEKKQNHLHQR